jgi:hypothetical protein
MAGIPFVSAVHRRYYQVLGLAGKCETGNLLSRAGFGDDGGKNCGLNLTGYILSLVTLRCAKDRRSAGRSQLIHFAL